MGQKKRWQQLSDELLVEATIAGCNEAFDELIRRYRSLIQGVAYGILGQKEQAEDVMQDALLISYRTLEHLKQPAHFSNWLYKITQHRAFRYQRTGKKEALSPLMEHEPNILTAFRSIDDPSEEFAQKEATQRLHIALNSLSYEYRIVIELRYWRNLKTKVISEALGIPETTVKWRLHKAKDILSQNLKKGAGNG